MQLSTFKVHEGGKKSGVARSVSTCVEKCLVESKCAVNQTQLNVWAEHDTVREC